MEGAKWKEFVASIKARGVIEPIIATDDLVIVSGHQRIRACKELGIGKVIVEVRHYDNDDEVIQDLLETNVRQRGTIGGSDTKLSRRIRELERLYGIQNGGDRGNQHTGGKPSSDSGRSANGTSGNSVPRSQEELARMLGFDSVDALKRAKKFGELPEDVQQAVNEGRISKSTAIRVIAQLPVDEQEALIKSLPATEKLTTKQVQELIKANEDLQNSIDALNSQLENAHDENEELHEQLENQPVKVETRTVYPADYDENKRKVDKLQKELDDTIKVNSKLQSAYADILKRNAAYQDTTLPETYDKGLIADAELFLVVVQRFSKDISGARYVSHHMDQVKEYSPTLWNNFSKAWEEIYAMAQLTCNYIQNINNPKLDS